MKPPARRKFTRFLTDSVHASLDRVNRLFENYQEIIWLVGDARSGTSWVTGLLNHEARYREVFEPFHPNLIDEMAFLVPHQYQRPAEQNARLHAVSQAVFSGKLFNWRVDQDTPLKLPCAYKGLLVKDIFANLLCRWVAQNFPKVRVVLLMRNPFSVALSKRKQRHWDWGIPDASYLLRQQALRSDHLAPFEDLIANTVERKDYILNHLLIWCIINYVPLRQFAPGQLDILIYEQLYQDPAGEIADLRLLLDGHKGAGFDRAAGRPSRVAGEASNVITGKSPIDSFKDELSREQIDEGYRIMDAFGLAEVYANPRQPDKDPLFKIYPAR